MKRVVLLGVAFVLILAMECSCGPKARAVPRTWSSAAANYVQGAGGIFMGEVDAGAVLGDAAAPVNVMLGWVSGLLGFGPSSLNQVVVTRPLISLGRANQARALDEVSGFYVEATSFVVITDTEVAGARWFGPPLEQAATIRALSLSLSTLSYR